MENTKKKNNIATIAGGCFWCTASAFDNQEGILEIVSGYIGGHIVDPTYEQVCSGSTGHYEAIRIRFDPHTISFRALLEIFFKQIDPTDDGGSFVDRGSQYRSAIFYHDETQKSDTLKLIDQINESNVFDHAVETQLFKAQTFYPAEEYHQGYHEKNPTRYRYYRAGSGRDIFINDNREKFDKIFNGEKLEL